MRDNALARIRTVGTVPDMNDESYHEWSRHYDTMQWTVAGILLSAVGALYVYTLEKYHLHLAIAGAALTLVCVFFTASFRRLRRVAQSKLEKDEDREALRNSDMFRQWPVNMSVQAVVFLAWVWALWLHEPQWRCCWLIAGVLGVIFIAIYYVKADEDPEKASSRAVAGGPDLKSQSSKD